jgi:hypothetical protein
VESELVYVGVDSINEVLLEDNEAAESVSELAT